MLPNARQVHGSIPLTEGTLQAKTLDHNRCDS
jgi:hypothetical protein